MEAKHAVWMQTMYAEKEAEVRYLLIKLDSHLQYQEVSILDYDMI